MPLQNASGSAARSDSGTLDEATGTGSGRCFSIEHWCRADDAREHVPAWTNLVTVINEMPAAGTVLTGPTGSGGG